MTVIHSSVSSHLFYFFRQRHRRLKFTIFWMVRTRILKFSGNKYCLALHLDEMDIDHFDANPDPVCHFDPDPGPACHFDADPDPDPSI